MDTQNTAENVNKTLPDEKLDSNFSLNKSEVSNASKLTKVNRKHNTKSSNKSDSKRPSFHSK